VQRVSSWADFCFARDGKIGENARIGAVTDIQKRVSAFQRYLWRSKDFLPPLTGVLIVSFRYDLDRIEDYPVKSPKLSDVILEASVDAGRTSPSLPKARTPMECFLKQENRAKVRPLAPPPRNSFSRLRDEISAITRLRANTVRLKNSRNCQYFVKISIRDDITSLKSSRL
jgi:hypothetical protein